MNKEVPGEGISENQILVLKILVKNYLKKNSQLFAALTDLKTYSRVDGEGHEMPEDIWYGMAFNLKVLGCFPVMLMPLCI